MDIIKKEFEYNMAIRSSTETLFLTRIFQQEESKSYVKASQMGVTDEEKAKHLKTFQSKKSVMYNRKLEKYPSNPKTLDELVIEGDLWTKCENGKDRFLIKDIQEFDSKTQKMMRIIIHGSDTLLKVLSEGDLITSDGVKDTKRRKRYKM